MNIKKKLKEYIKECNLKNIIFNSVIISLFIFVLDFYDQPSKVIGRDITYGECFIFIHIIIFLIALYFILNSGFKCLTSDDCNPLDNLIFYGLFVSLFTIPTNIFMNHDLWINYEIVLICLIILGLRIIFILKPRKKGIKSNLVSLTELRNGNVPNEVLLLIKEEPLTTSIEDLLDYSKTKESLKKFITECHTDKSFVLGLVGEWGSGKTSLINMVKKELPNNEIVNFNIWNYKDEQSMFDGLYKLLIKTLGQKVNKIELRKNLNQYKKILFGYIKTKCSLPFDNIISDYSYDLGTIKEEINKLIKTYQKDIIIVIDDLDRISKEQLLFAIKLINNIIDFEQVKYILCYEEYNIKKILGNDYDDNYIDKIVNAKIRMPEIEKETFNGLVNELIQNILKARKIDTEEYGYDLTYVLDLISEDIDNIRDVVRFINSLSLCLNNLIDCSLYAPDFIALEYIKFANHRIYKTIYYNLRYFLVNVQKDTEKANSEINKVGASNSQKELISNIFQKTNFNTEQLLAQKRCCTSQYAYNYFGVKHTKYTLIDERVEELIDYINNGEITIEEFNGVIKEIPRLDFFIKKVICNLNRINDMEKLLVVLLNYNSTFSEIIIRIFINIPEKTKYKFLNKYLKENEIILTKLINHYHNHGGSEEYKKLVENAERLLKRIIKRKMENKIDIFSKENYRITFFNYRKYFTEDEIKKYISSILNCQNILRFFNCVMEKWNSDVTSIHCDKTFIAQYVDLEVVEQIIKEMDARKLNREEKAILNAYKKIEVVVNRDYNFENIRYLDKNSK